MIGKKDILSGSGLKIGYRQGQEEKVLIENLNFRLYPGELTAIIGMNGSGKSSLLRTMMGLEKKLDGELKFSGKNLEEYEASHLAKMVSMVSTGWAEGMHIRLSELVSLGRFPYTGLFGRLSEEDRQIVDESIRVMKLEKLSRERISEISDGEKQRAMIARAIAQDSPVILMDEPTAFLDILNKYEILSYLKKLCTHGKTILFSTHDFQLASRYADRFWLISSKTLIEDSPEELFLNGTIERVFSSEKMTFDYVSGDFVPCVEEGKAIQLELHAGTDTELYWTGRAMMRAGFRLAEKDENPEFQVKIKKESGQIIWNLQTEKQNLLFNKLLDLVNYLKTSNHEPG